ncbi:MFS transporter [bacterium]|nr:MFS transporter [bacterium]
MNRGFEKDPSYERWRLRIFGVTWLAYAGFYLTRQSFSVAKIGIAEDSSINMTSSQMGAIDGVFLFAYSMGQFVWGFSGDKFGPRVIVMYGLLGSVAAALAMGASSMVFAFGVLALIQGLSQSTGWAPLAKNVRSWFSLRERGVVMGWWSTNYAVGSLVAVPFAGYVADYFLNWRYAFYIPALVLFVIWILFAVLQRNRPEDVGLPAIEEYHREQNAVSLVDDQAEESVSWKLIIAVLKNPMVLLLAVVYFFLKPTRYAILFWGPKFINETLNTGMAESGLLSVAFFLAGPISVLAAGYASDKLFQSKRMPYSVISLLLLAIVLFTINGLAELQNKLIMTALLFTLGFLLYGPDSLISATAALDFGTKKGASTATGLINGMGSVGAIIGGIIPGFFKDSWGWGGIFVFLGISVTMAALLLIPNWNKLPRQSDLSVA